MSFPSPRTRTIGWQVYRAQSFAPDRTRDGEYRDRVEYKAPCADPRCGGAVFTATTSKTCWRGRQLNRRCRKHSHPGDKVDNARPPVPFTCIPLEFWPKDALAGKAGSTKTKRRAGRPAGREERVKRASAPSAASVSANSSTRPSYLD